MTEIVPGGDEVLISIEYDDTGLAWARLYDNRALAWHINDIGSSLPPVPAMIGTLPRAAPNTLPVISPQWAVLEGERAVIVPNLWRGSIADFFTWLATNNGARRPLEKRLGVSTALHNGFDAWAQEHRDLVVRTAWTA